MADCGLQRDEGAQRVAHYVGLPKLQMSDQSGNVVAHRFTAQWPVGVRRAPMRLKMDGDHLPALGQFSQIAPEAVWVDAPVKKNERLAGAMHAVKDMLTVDVGKIRIRHSGGLLGLNGKGCSQRRGRCGSLQEIASEHIVLTSRRTGQRGGGLRVSS